MPTTYPSSRLAHPSCFRWSHGKKVDTTRYPRTIVSFAIVMLGTGVERYAARSAIAYLRPPLMLYEDYLDNRLCSSRLTMAAVDGECMGRNLSSTTLKQTFLSFRSCLHVSTSSSRRPIFCLGISFQQSKPTIDSIVSVPVDLALKVTTSLISVRSIPVLPVICTPPVQPASLPKPSFFDVPKLVPWCPDLQHAQIGIELPVIPRFVPVVAVQNETAACAARVTTVMYVLDFAERLNVKEKYCYLTHLP